MEAPQGFCPFDSQDLTVPSRQQVLNRESYAFELISWPQQESIWGALRICNDLEASCHGRLARRHWILKIIISASLSRTVEFTVNSYLSSTTHKRFFIESIIGLFLLEARSENRCTRILWANSLSRSPWVHCLGTILKIILNDLICLKNFICLNSRFSMFQRDLIIRGLIIKPLIIHCPLRSSKEKGTQFLTTNFW